MCSMLIPDVVFSKIGCGLVELTGYQSKQLSLLHRYER